MPVRAFPTALTVKVAPFNSPLVLLLRKHTTLSPATGMGSVLPINVRMRVLKSRRVLLRPTSTWSEANTRFAMASLSMSPRRTMLLVPNVPMGSGSPFLICIDRRIMGLSCAWRCTSVSITSGSCSVKNPPPLTGGNWAGSPSTSTGTPNDIRSLPSSASTIEHSSMTTRSQFFTSDWRLMVKLGSPVSSSVLER